MPLKLATLCFTLPNQNNWLAIESGYSLISEMFELPIELEEGECTSVERYIMNETCSIGRIEDEIGLVENT